MSTKMDVKHHSASDYRCNFGVRCSIGKIQEWDASSGIFIVLWTGGLRLITWTWTIVVKTIWRIVRHIRGVVVYLRRVLEAVLNTLWVTIVRAMIGIASVDKTMLPTITSIIVTTESPIVNAGHWCFRLCSQKSARRVFDCRIAGRSSLSIWFTIIFDKYLDPLAKLGICIARNPHRECFFSNPTPV